MERPEEPNSVGMPDGKTRPIDDIGERVFAPPEPTVADLVANLRARCEESVGFGEPQSTAVVTLPVDLVLAIADGIEASVVVGQVDFGDQFAGVTETAAKEIVKLLVTRTFADAKQEAEEALEACRRLGLDEQQIAAIMVPKEDAISKWAPLVMARARWRLMPLIWSLVKGGLGG